MLKMQVIIKWYSKQIYTSWPVFEQVTVQRTKWLKMLMSSPGLCIGVTKLRTILFNKVKSHVTSDDLQGFGKLYFVKQYSAIVTLINIKNVDGQFFCSWIIEHYPHIWQEYLKQYFNLLHNKCPGMNESILHKQMYTFNVKI